MTHSKNAYVEALTKTSDSTSAKTVMGDGVFCGGMTFFSHLTIHTETEIVFTMTVSQPISFRGRGADPQWCQ